jgi:hypothetical protein
MHHPARSLGRLLRRVEQIVREVAHAQRRNTPIKVTIEQKATFDELRALRKYGDNTFPLGSSRNGCSRPRRNGSFSEPRNRWQRRRLIGVQPDRRHHER